MRESLVQVLHYVDYRTVVLSKLAGQCFLRLTLTFAEELARRRSFRVAFSAVSFYGGEIEYTEVTIAEGNFQYEPGNQTSLVAACRELEAVIVGHRVAELTFYCNTWNMAGGDVIFGAAPALKYAEIVVLRRRYGETEGSNFESFASNFAGMKELHLLFNENVFCAFTWTFLRRQAARDLQLMKVTGIPSVPSEDVKRSIDLLVGECTSLPRPLGGEALELDFSNNYFSGEFALWIIEVIT